MNNKTIDEIVESRVKATEDAYKKQVDSFISSITSRCNSYLTECVKNNSTNTKAIAELEVLKPALIGIVNVLKSNGILKIVDEYEHNPVSLTECMNVMHKQTSIIEEQQMNIKNMKDKLDIYTMLIEKLSGLSKNLIDQTVENFRDRDPNDENLIEDLMSFISSKKVNTIKINPLSGMNNDDEDLSSIDSLLESIDDKKKQKTPSKSHIKTRKVNVNNLHNVGFSNDSD